MKEDFLKNGYGIVCWMKMMIKKIMFEELIIAIHIHWLMSIHIYKQKYITKAVYRLQKYLKDVL